VSKQIFSKFQNFRSVLIYFSLNEIMVPTSGIRASSWKTGAYGPSCQIPLRLTCNQKHRNITLSERKGLAVTTQLPANKIKLRI
jgi:hypothetical protein